MNLIDVIHRINVTNNVGILALAIMKENDVI